MLLEELFGFQAPRTARGCVDFDVGHTVSWVSSLFYKRIGGFLYLHFFVHAMGKTVNTILSLVSLIFGIIFLFNSTADITGSVIGLSTISPLFSSIFGIVLILVSGLLFVGGESLEKKIGMHDYENDEDYQKLKRKLESKGERVVKKGTMGHIDFKTYKHLLEKKLYKNFPTKMPGAYDSDSGEFFGRKKESDSSASRYLQERLKEINRDQKRVSEITAIIHSEGKKYDESEVKRRRDELLKQYNSRKIDEVEFAKELNDVGEFTGGEYNPGNRHLSVKIMGHPMKIPEQGNNPDLARALHRKILENSPSYTSDCEFHYSKQASTKHHTSGL